MSNYPPGAANDPNAPYNEPLLRPIQVELNVELGTIIDVEMPYDSDGYIDMGNLRDAVETVLKERYNIDNTETVLNDIHIWGINDLSC